MNVTADSLLDRVKDIAPIIRAHAAEAEEKRRLSRPVVDAMLQAGLHSMARPKAFGGLEVNPLTMFRVVEEVARHDSAAGWNVQLAVAILDTWHTLGMRGTGSDDVVVSEPLYS